MVGLVWVRRAAVVALASATVFAAVFATAFATLTAAAMAKPAAALATPAHIVAIGDLHGDYGAWLAIARAAGLVDKGGRWAGGATVLVQMGDVPDRGADSLRIMRDLMRLQKQAPKAGGEVLALVGNHEAMNMTGDLRYVSAGEFAAFADSQSDRRRERTFDANRPAIEAAYRNTNPGMESPAIRQAWLAATPLGKLEHMAAWQPKGEIGRWVAGNPAVVLLDGTLFVHGGISAGYSGLSVDAINRAVATALLAGDTAETSILHDPLGPLWYRGFAGNDQQAEAGKPDEQNGQAAANSVRAEPPMSIETELDLVLRAYSARRMVIAHTPHLAGILMRQDGRLARIDTGISYVYGGTPSYLEILNGRMIAHTVARSSARKLVDP